MSVGVFVGGFVLNEDKLVGVGFIDQDAVGVGFGDEAELVLVVELKPFAWFFDEVFDENHVSDSDFFGFEDGVAELAGGGGVGADFFEVHVAQDGAQEFGAARVMVAHDVPIQMFDAVVEGA